MKRLTVLLAIVLAGIGYAIYAQAATMVGVTPTIVITRLTTTTMRIQLAGMRATGLDTIKVYSAVADSLTGPKYWFKAAVTKDTTVASLTPGTTYIWKVRADSSGTYKTSAPDTAQTYFPQVEFPVQPGILYDWRSAAKATAWPPTNTYSYTWTLRTSAALDSSMVYENWAYVGSTIIATGDSAVFKDRIMAGLTDLAGNPYYAAVDSLSITAKGTYVKSWSIPVGAKHWYHELFGATGNGNATSVSIYNHRVRQ